MPRDNIIIISLKMPVAVVRDLDKLVEKKIFSSRSEAVRQAVRELLTKYQRHLGRGEPKPLVGYR